MWERGCVGARVCGDVGLKVWVAGSSAAGPAEYEDPTPRTWDPKLTAGARVTRWEHRDRVPLGCKHTKRSGVNQKPETDNQKPPFHSLRKTAAGSMRAADRDCQVTAPTASPIATSPTPPNTSGSIATRVAKPSSHRLIPM